jgi:N-acetylglutamate synthase-like GNAT family acetyltransferase
MTDGKEIVGCYALIVNDFISRHDLLPWFACLFIEEPERGKRLSGRMFDHAKLEARGAGHDTIFLTTDHSELYEKFGWERIEDGYDLDGERTRIYKLSTDFLP